MRGLSGRSDDGTFAHRVISDSRQKPGTLRGPAGKLMKALSEATDSLSFDPSEFAFYLALCPNRMQRGFIDLARKYFAVLAEKADSGLWVDDDERLVAQDGKAIHQAMSFLHD